MANLDFRGVGDSRPTSSTAPPKDGSDMSPVATGLDFRGEMDSRPKSNPDDCEHVNVGSGEKSGKKSGTY